MRRFFSTILLAGIIVGGAWVLYHRDQLGSPEKIWDYVKQQFPFESGTGVPAQLSSWSAHPRNPGTIRVASFNLQGLGSAKLSDPLVAERVAEILSAFDVIALQDILPNEEMSLQRLVKLVNQRGGSHAFSLSPLLGRGSLARHSAFVFNQQTVQLDDAFAYVVQDPGQVFTRQPYVGWFRAAQARPDRALTLTLINLDLDPRRLADELDALGPLFRTVRRDSREEDDLVLLGTFGTDSATLSELTPTTGLKCALSKRPTDPQCQRESDNLLYSPIASTEFTGESGVFDFLKQFNLTGDEALRISNHLPIWADFSIYEGETPGRVAERVIDDASR